MCGRYSFVPSQKQIDTQLSDLERPAEFKLSFNIAPTQPAFVVTDEQPGLLQAMTWGLVPHWSPDGANGGRLINARAEGIESKPSFREPIRRRHCLVWADSFYEWRHLPGRRKIPYRILPADGSLLCFAGIWDEWRQGGKILRTFSIITTTPNRELAGLHDRMPVLLPDPAARRQWLSPQALEATLAMLHPPADDYLRLYPVSERVNSPANDGPDLHEETREEPTLF